MTITHAVGRNFEISLVLPRRASDSTYDCEDGGDNSVLYEDTPENRQKDIDYFRREYFYLYVYQEEIND